MTALVTAMFTFPLGEDAALPPRTDALTEASRSTTPPSAAAPRGPPPGPAPAARKRADAAPGRRPARHETSASYLARLASLHGLDPRELWQLVSTPRPGTRRRDINPGRLAAITGGGLSA